jgi:glutamine amidotransferase-like uncharacterized protein
MKIMRFIPLFYLMQISIWAAPPPTLVGKSWVLDAQHHGVSLKWRKNLEQNLRWAIARQTIADRSGARVGVFVDGGCHHIGAKNIVQALEESGVSCRLFDRAQMTQENFRELDAFIVPGGYSFFEKIAAGKEGIDVMRSFVSHGGRFLGVCAGAYLASKDVLWEEKNYSYPLGFFDGTAEGALDHIAKWPNDTGVRVKLTAAGKKRGLQPIESRSFYYKGGPRFQGGTDYDVLAKYEDGSSAMISRAVGKGEILLAGPHFERVAPRDGATNAPPPSVAGDIFLNLLKLTKSPSVHVKIDPGILKSVDLDPLAQEDRLNLEANLRWMLARTRAQWKTPDQKPQVGVFMDIGATHEGTVEIVKALESEGVTCRLLNQSLLNGTALNKLKAFILPDGDSLILKKSLGEKGGKKIKGFLQRGGHLLCVSGSAYVPAKTVRLYNKTYNFPLALINCTAEWRETGASSGTEQIEIEFSKDSIGLPKGIFLGQGGVGFSGGVGYSVIANFKDQTPAIIGKRAGKGKVILLGVNPINLKKESDISPAHFILKLLSLNKP